MANADLRKVDAAAPSGRVRGVSKNSAEARRKILDSATLIFGAQGFARTKTEQIAEHAGYGQATIFFHFKTKAGLLEACLEDALARAKDSVVAGEFSGTVDLVLRLDNAFDNHATAEFFFRMFTEFGDSSAVKPLYAAFHAHLRELIAAELTRETGVGGDRAYRVAGAILSTMVGVHAEQRLETVRLSRADFRDMLVSVTRLLLRDLSESASAAP